MTWSDLQVLTDEIAERLGAPCIVEDEEQRTVVYSSHTMPIDDVRRDSILRRETAPGVRDWFRQFGILEALEPIRIPGIRLSVCWPGSASRSVTTAGLRDSCGSSTMTSR